uniref:Non-structural protein n=1 Tax=Melon yellow spot virus TaxID=89471 RepID=D8MIU9_9VIRU|nr:non-structural protein [Melon yellow spot virus]
MANAYPTAVGYVKAYGSKDKKAVNDCYAVFNGEGTNILNLFMHSNSGVKSAFSINELGRNEDMKIQEAEALTTLHDQKFFDHFGLDITFCGHVLNVIVRKHDVSNIGCKFSQHNLIFCPNEETLDFTPTDKGLSLSEEEFFKATKITSEGFHPQGWCVEECKKNRFTVAETSCLELNYGSPIMGKTVAYWRENISGEKLVTVKPKCVNVPTALPNRLLPSSTVKAIQIGSELAKQATVVLSVRQSLSQDLKSQYRVTFPGVLEDLAYSRSYLVPFGAKNRIIRFDSRTISDRENEQTTLILKTSTKTIESNFTNRAQEHKNCIKSIGERLGLVDFVMSEPNYSQIIASDFLRLQTVLSLRVSKHFKKPVIVYKLYDKETELKKVKIDGKFVSYNEDSEGNVYVLNKTLDLFPKSNSSFMYLSRTMSPFWKEFPFEQHLVVDYNEFLERYLNSSSDSEEEPSTSGTSSTS